ncbi:MAG: TIGR00730 family Rossman fold protein [Steroidobacteraceae bacterium]
MAARSIAVFCGSAHGVDPAHGRVARTLGHEIARRGWTLVYGGGRVGLMGELADAALEAGGPVIGVIPRFLYDWEVGHDGLTELEIVATLTERKVRMVDLADAFIALPGGIGTLDELFEVLSWVQLGLARKSCVLVDVDGYYAPLIEWFDRAVEAGFLKPAHRALLRVATDPVAALDGLRQDHRR